MSGGRSKELASGGLPPPSAGRRHDDQRLARLQNRLRAALQFLDPAVVPSDEIAAELADLAARDPEIGHAAMAGQQRQIHALNFGVAGGEVDRKSTRLNSSHT